MEFNFVVDQHASSPPPPQTDRSTTPTKMFQSVSSPASSPYHEPLEPVDEDYPLSQEGFDEEGQDSIVTALASPKPASPVSQRSIFRPPSEYNLGHQSTSPLNKSPGQNGGRTTEDPRLALFDDHVASAHVPGSLHLAPDSTIERLVERQGVIPLIRQLASDLAHRDRELVSIRRRAEERERALKKMLVEVEVSNAAIERRLATATLQRKVSRETMRSIGEVSYTDNIDEMMQQAMSEEDVFSVRDDSFGERVDGNMDWGEDERFSMKDDMATPKATVRTRSDSRSILFERDSDCFSITSNESSSRRESTLKGWRDYFWGQKPRGAREEEYSKLRPALGHQNAAKRRGITTETFSPPPELDSRSSMMSRSSSRASIHSPTKQNRAASLQITSTIRRTASPSSLYTYPHFASDQSFPAPPQFTVVSLSQKEGGEPTENGVQRRSSNTVAAWALRLVAHAPPSDQENQSLYPRSPSVPQRSVSGPVEESSMGSNRRLSSGSVDRENLQRIMAKNTARLQTSPRRRALSTTSNGGPTGNSSKFFQGFIDHAERIVPLGNNSQNGPVADPSSGPVEMDTIVPHAIQPPTLLQSWNEYYPTDYLTDRFGFIYNKNHRSPSTKNGTKKDSKGAKEIPETEAPEDETPGSSADERLNGEGAAVTDTGDPKVLTKWQELLMRPPSPSTGSSHISPKATTAESSLSAHGGHTKSRPQAIAILGKVSKSPNTTTFSEAPLALRSPMNAETPSGTEAQTVKLLLGQLSDLHDSLQRDRSIKWNEFFKKIRRERRRGEEEERGMPEVLIGDGELIGIATLGNEGRGGKQRWKEFKSLVLGGIPVAYRWKVWAECSSATALRVPGYYEDILQNGQDDPLVISQIAMDINRTLTDNIFYRKGPGVQKLKQVLVAYSRRHPAVGYCQGMNMIAASLLLIMPSEEDAFWVLCSIIEKILPKTYFETSLLASRADQQVLKQYVHEVLPTLDSHLSKLGVELEALTFQWFLSIFTDCLAAEALFRVWDVILCLVGSPFLFQVALALLKLNEKALLDCNSAAGVYSYLNGEMTHQGISIDGLIRESDGMRGMVKRVDVERRREQAVKRELADMAAGEEEEAARLEANLAVEAPATAVAAEVTVVIATEEASPREETTEKVVEAGSDGQEPVPVTVLGIAEETVNEVAETSGCIPEGTGSESLARDTETSTEVQEISDPGALGIATDATDQQVAEVVEITCNVLGEVASETELLIESAGVEKLTLGKFELEVSLSPVALDEQESPETSPSPPQIATVISAV